MTNEVKTPSGFLEVFLIRSFRESHLDDVKNIIKGIVNDWPSPYWSHVQPAKPFRLHDTERKLVSGEWILSEICKGISNAAICVVILDGMRPNVLFELGYLRALGRPYIILKHCRFGPTFAEIGSNVSDLNGMVVKEYEHENRAKFDCLFKTEFARCDMAFAHGLGTHLAFQRQIEPDDNLINQANRADWKASDPNKPGHWTGDGLEIPTGGVFEYELNRHSTQQSMFIVRGILCNKCSTLTAYLYGHFRKAEKELAVWYGYASQTVAPYGDHRDDPLPVEITIPLSVSGPSDFTLIDNIWRMAADRLKTCDVGPLRISKVRLWAKDGPTVIKEIRITA